MCVFVRLSGRGVGILRRTITSSKENISHLHYLHLQVAFSGSAEAHITTASPRWCSQISGDEVRNGLADWLKAATLGPVIAVQVFVKWLRFRSPTQSSHLLGVT